NFGAGGPRRAACTGNHAAPSGDETRRAEGHSLPHRHHVEPDRRPGARRAVRQGTASGRVPRHGKGPRRALRGQPQPGAGTARDALRTLEAQGIVEIKVGSGGGARIARGNARLFAEALAVQLDLAGVSVAEIMDAQRAIECLAAELAAANSTPEDHARLRELIAEAERRIDDVGAFTRLGREFHLSVAEASHNRVLVVQLVSLQHVSWPAQNPTLTPSVARRVLDAHMELAARIEMRDDAGAR